MPPSILKYKATSSAGLDPKPILWKDVLEAGGSGCSSSCSVVSTSIKRQMPSDRIVSSSPSGDFWNCGAPPIETSTVMNPTTNNTIITHSNGATCVPISSSSSSSSSSNSEVASSSSSRYKSELCRNYSTDGSKICKFGANCIYAHGESELRRPTLGSLHSDGKIDIETHRQLPCFICVSTGSCAFSRRCKGLHDPRVVDRSSSSSSIVLPFKEKYHFCSSDMSLLYVDASYQGIMDSVLNRGLFSDPTLTYEDISHIACNERADGSDSTNSLLLSKKIKLDIALQMRSSSNNVPIYKSNIKLCDKACMMLQYAEFAVLRDNRSYQTPRRLDSWSSRYHDDQLYNKITVHEIAFGPNAGGGGGMINEYKSRRSFYHQGQALAITNETASEDDDGITRVLWFNLPRGTVDQFRENERFNSHVNVRDLRDRFEFFNVVSVSAQEEYLLVTEIMQDRLRQMQELTEVHSSQLRDRVEALRLHYKKWSWPNARGNVVDFELIEPDTRTKYKPTDGFSNCEYAEKIWNGFLNYFTDDDEDDVLLQETSSRLNTLNNVSTDLVDNGAVTISYNDKVTLLPPYLLEEQPKDIKLRQNNARSERCWKSILLKDGPKDWKVIMDEAKCGTLKISKSGGGGTKSDGNSFDFMSFRNR